MRPLERRSRTLCRRVIFLIAISACWGWAILLPGARVHAQMSMPHTIAVQVPNAQPPAALAATEVRGLLPHTGDRHFFGLAAAQPGAALAVTLTAEPASAVQAGGDVNFIVLTEEGLRSFLAGVDPFLVKHAIGSPLLFDQVGNRLTTLVPGTAAGGYTVIVFNNATTPVAYTLQVQGGVLRDDARQTLFAIQATADPRQGIIRRLAVAPTLANALPQAPVTLPADPLRARRISGTLAPLRDRHYLNLVADAGDEIVLTLRTALSQETAGVNFWVMTQDGVRHLVLGGLAQELNLATGHLVSAGDTGQVYEARLRAAPNLTYTVVVFNDGLADAAYSLSVRGGVLIDPYGQTNEARAAALEVMALATR